MMEILLHSPEQLPFLIELALAAKLANIGSP